MAYEKLNGPLLIHERVDFGLAVLALIMANAWSKKRFKLRDFLPPWYENAKIDPLEGFKQLMALAEDNADNLDTDRQRSE